MSQLLTGLIPAKNDIQIENGSWTEEGKTLGREKGVDGKTKEMRENNEAYKNILKYEKQTWGWGIQSAKRPKRV